MTRAMSVGDDKDDGKPEEHKEPTRRKGGKGASSSKRQAHPPDDNTVVYADLLKIVSSQVKTLLKWIVGTAIVVGILVTVWLYKCPGQGTPASVRKVQRLTHHCGDAVSGINDFFYDQLNIKTQLDNLPTEDTPSVLLGLQEYIDNCEDQPWFRPAWEAVHCTTFLSKMTWTTPDPNATNCFHTLTGITDDLRTITRRGRAEDGDDSPEAYLQSKLYNGASKSEAAKDLFECHSQLDEALFSEHRMNKHSHQLGVKLLGVIEGLREALFARSSEPPPPGHHSPHSGWYQDMNSIGSMFHATCATIVCLAFLYVANNCFKGTNNTNAFGNHANAQYPVATQTISGEQRKHWLFPIVELLMDAHTRGIDILGNQGDHHNVPELVIAQIRAAWKHALFLVTAVLTFEGMCCFSGAVKKVLFYTLAPVCCYVGVYLTLCILL